ncbi:MAG: hypothetical protein IKL40_00790 [Clostridia bacterium]|nr:hypothetical protein [Clostridia bacterium]
MDTVNKNLQKIV